MEQEPAEDPGRRRIRVGIDTGGTFTDVVGVDEDTGAIVAVKTPSTPADPAEGFLTGIRKVLTAMRAGPDDLVSVAHGTTVATNQLLTGDVTGIGFVTTEGFEHLLEIARQSVPDGYGNSYFWVKPPRIVPADLVRTVGGRLDHTGAQLRPFDADGARTVARWLRSTGSPRSGCASCTRTPTRRTRSACATSSPRSTRTPWSPSHRRCCGSTASTSGR